MTTAVKEEAFEITANTTGITSNNLAAVSADKSLQIVWEYEVPVGYALVFTSEDVLSAYLEDNTGNHTACVETTTRVDVVIMDSSRHNVRAIMEPCLYLQMQDFADADRFKHMDIAPGEQVIANEGERVCVRVAPPTAVPTLDAADSYFRLTCKRIRHTLFG